MNSKQNAAEKIQAETLAASSLYIGLFPSSPKNQVIIHIMA